MPNRLLIDFKEDHKGEIRGRMSHPADSVFVLEALALAIQQFSKACGVPAVAICSDIAAFIKKEERVK